MPPPHLPPITTTNHHGYHRLPPPANKNKHNKQSRFTKATHHCLRAVILHGGHAVATVSAGALRTRKLDLRHSEAVSKLIRHRCRRRFAVVVVVSRRCQSSSLFVVVIRRRRRVARTGSPKNGTGTRRPTKLQNTDANTHRHRHTYTREHTQHNKLTRRDINKRM